MSNEEKKNGLQENDSPKQVEAGTEESQSKKIETKKRRGEGHNGKRIAKKEEDNWGQRLTATRIA